MKFINSTKRMTGFVLPLLSLRTDRGPCGEFPDIAAMARLARSWEMDVVQLLPVNDTGWQTSPYSALSAFALNPIYLSIEDMPELAASRKNEDVSNRPQNKFAGDARTAAALVALVAAKKMSADFGSATKVPYTGILERKLGILEFLWRALSAGEKGRELVEEVEAWSSEKTWVKPYVCFVELKRRFDGAAWWEWPDCRTVDTAFIDSLWNKSEYVSAYRFQAWLQMRAEEQLAGACAEARELGVDVMGDIPILMNADSADVWFQRKLFDTGRAAGAPPDMYSQLGQNWGFPLYRWDEIERQGYSFWKDRLVSADRFYTLYRIDHVLGFFRIWAIDKYEVDGFLGHFVPEFSISYPELDALGFDAGRIRWLSRPHVPQSAIDEALSRFSTTIGEEIRERLFTRIGNEPLYLFAKEMRGGADIAEVIRAAATRVASAETATQVTVPESALSFCQDRLLFWWRNRAFLEIASGQFVPTWEYRGTKAWGSLADHEKSQLEALISRKKGESMALWERAGRKILKVLAESVDMQACAEDLGAVPPCVPAVLRELGIPGLRVLRWHRAWDKEGSPYIPLNEYPVESVACTSVHDSTNLRQWWEEEADREALWAMVKRALEAEKAAGAGQASKSANAVDTGVHIIDAAAPAVLDPDSALLVLKAFASARSRCVVYPIQDLLAASARHREAKAADERINVPGTMSDANWLYRMKPRLEELMADREFATKIASLPAAR